MGAEGNDEGGGPAVVPVSARCDEIHQAIEELRCQVIRL
jgi:hypothetical protein